MRIKVYIKRILGFVKCFKHHIKVNGNCYIGWRVKIINRGLFILGDHAQIRPLCAIFTHNDFSELKIGKNSEIGQMSTISCFNRIIIGDGVLTGPHVFIGDNNHDYRNPNIHIYRQGVYAMPEDEIIIGDGTWLGTNVVVVGNVKIGKQCVIGANSVVNRDIPDYCVAVGMPCKVVRRYNWENKQWEKT